MRILNKQTKDRTAAAPKRNCVAIPIRDDTATAIVPLMIVLGRRRFFASKAERRPFAASDFFPAIDTANCIHQ